MKTEDASGPGDLRRRAEARFKARPAAASRKGEEAQRLLHELQVHQIELEIQNEELLQARERAEEAALRYTELYDFAPVGYFTLDRAGRISQMNPSGARLLGVDRAAAKGRSLRQFVRAGARPAFDAFLGSTGRAGHSFQVSLDKGDGTLLEVILTAGLSDAGKQLFMVAVDITERKALELALEKMSKALRRKNTELSDFLYISSHDLRGPLVNIQGFSKNVLKDCAEIVSRLDALKKDGEPTAWIRGLLSRNIPESVRFVIDSAKKMDSIISNLLKMSRLGCVDLKLEIVDMDALVARVARDLTFQLKEAGAELKVGKLPPCQADPAQLAQVFSNLMDNAVKYRSTDRKLVIDISGSILRSGGSCYVVADNGKGFTEDEAREKIWRLFYRADQRSGASGEGIGLTISKVIIERHGGTMKAKAAHGGGAEFIVELPNAGLETDPTSSTAAGTLRTR